MPDDIKQQLACYFQSREDRRFDLSRNSHARVGLGHTGGHLQLKDWLDFQCGFAQAKDAVYSAFTPADIVKHCEQSGLTALPVHSQALDATQFLLRPDLGRVMANESVTLVQDYIHQHASDCGKDLLLVISGGLSPLAVQQQVPGFLTIFLKLAQEQRWSCAPVVINARGRVALGDQLNQHFKARIVIMLIGERPGLTTPDSLGIYFTYGAKPGCTDEQRNCISNIHERGLTHAAAAGKLVSLLQKAFAMQNSGICLKDDELSLETD